MRSTTPPRSMPSSPGSALRCSPPRCQARTLVSWPFRASRRSGTCASRPASGLSTADSLRKA
eukprot:9489494-Pyramimonas_sp.AAC.1